jgi:hypothetical protein
MRSPAPQAVVQSETAKLLAIVGQTAPALASELSQAVVTNSMLNEMKFWNGLLAPHAWRDRIGKAAVRFWAAQTLVSTVMRSSFLDPNARFSPGITQAMEDAADGLLEFGQSQFDTLARVVRDIASWIAAQEPRAVALIESPIGNTLPVQLLSDLLLERKVSHEIVLWNAPRNDRPNKGRTVKQSGKDCAASTRDFDYVVLVDEVQTGTRFIKLFEALADEVGRDRFFPFAMLFEDTSKPKPDLTRLNKRLDAQASLIGYPLLRCGFPLLRLFRLDGGNFCKWQSPVVWGDSDLIAGKRKVNLVFMLLDHDIDILEDLGAAESVYRPYLEIAWKQNTLGHAFQFAPGLVQSTFANILKDLPIKEFRQKLHRQARQRFPEDYLGDINLLAKYDVEARSAWLRDAFVFEATSRVGVQRAWMGWNAVQAVFEASFPDKKPLSKRDADAAPYVLPVNRTVSTFNNRLRARLA